MDPSPHSYDVGESIWLNAMFLTGSTTGTILEGQALLLVRDTVDLTLTVGAPIVVVGAGAIGGDLVTTITAASGQSITLATVALHNANLAAVGNPAAPATITCTVRDPEGEETNPSVTNPSAGRYRALFAASLDGDHYFRFVGTGAASADRWRKFIVRPERVPGE